MRKEIGSEFDISIEFLLDAFHNKRLSQNKIPFENVTDIVYLSNGRSAIKFILSHVIKKNYIKKYWLPSYLCETIVQPFKELNLKYEFYNLKEDLQLDTEYLSEKVEKNDLILTLYYFGFPPSKEVINFLYKMKNNSITIIEDLTHFFLNNNIRLYKTADYSIISLRKWFSIPDGGIAISNNDLFDKALILKEPFYKFTHLRLAAAILKNLYLRGIINNKEPFREMLNNAEKLAASQININTMSNFSKAILNFTNFENIVDKRRKNFLYLLSNIVDLKKISPLYIKLEDGVCPLGFPIITSKRDILRKFLIDNNIFCPIHWILPPNILKKFSYSYYLSNNILTIPCDQRYSIKDMKIIIRRIKKFYEDINEY